MTPRASTLSVLIASGMAASAAHAQLHTWVAGDGTWNTAANWDQVSVPDAPGESALIASAGVTVTISTAFPNIDALSLTPGDAALLINGGRTLTLGAGGLTNNGLIVANANNSSADTIVVFREDAALTGTGALRLNRGGNDARLQTAALVTVTNGAGHTISGTGRVLGAIINEGMIDADNSGAGGSVLTLASDDKANNGIIRATSGGVLEVEALTLTQGAAGVIRADGGTIRFANGHAVTIDGGSIENLASTIERLGGTTTLRDVQLTGDFNVLGGGAIAITGAGITHTGEILINSNNTSADAVIQFDESGSLMGAGVVRMNRLGNDARFETLAGVTATIGAGYTVRGTGRINASVINDGAIDADNSGAGGSTLTLSANDKINNAVMRATNAGTLAIESIAIDQSGGGVIRADGGAVVFLNGHAATVDGGTLENLGGTFERQGGTTTLHDVTVHGVLDVLGGGTIVVTGAGLTHDGEIVLNSSNSSADAVIQFNESGALMGTGDLRMNRLGTDARFETDDFVTATVGADYTVRGTGRVNASLINDGTIDADNSGVGGATLTLATNDKANNAVMRATNTGTLEINAVTIDQTGGGVIRADGGTVSFVSGPSAVVGGTIENVSGAVVRQGGTTTLQDTTVEGNFDVLGGGSIELAGSTFTNNGVVTLNSNNSAADAVLMVNESMTIDGAGTLRLGRAGADSRFEVASADLTVSVGPDVRLEGLGTVVGPLTLEGVTAPGLSVGRMSPGGADPITMAPSHTFEMEISPVGFDSFDAISGSTCVVELNGTLHVVPTDGYVPTFGDRFVAFVRASSVEGYFETIDAPDVSPYFWMPVYNGNSVDLAVTCRVDLTGDATVNTNDFFKFLGYYQDGHPLADITGEGAINTNDFFAFLALYQQGC